MLCGLTLPMKIFWLRHGLISHLLMFISIMMSFLFSYYLNIIFFYKKDFTFLGQRDFIKNYLMITMFILYIRRLIFFHFLNHPNTPSNQQIGRYTYLFISFKIPNRARLIKNIVQLKLRNSWWNNDQCWLIVLLIMTRQSLKCWERNRR